jgi:hypothetical protein
MRYGGLRVLTALVLFGLVAFLTGGAYAAGYAEGANHVGTVSPWVYGGFGASHVVGFIIGILILVLILRLVFFGAFAHRRHWGYGPRWGNTGPGDWSQGPWRDPRQTWFDDWHRHAHEAPATQPGQPGAGGGSPNANA